MKPTVAPLYQWHTKGRRRSLNLVWSLPTYCIESIRLLHLGGFLFS